MRPENRLVDVKFKGKMPCWFATNIVKKIHKNRWKITYRVEG